LNAHAHTHTQTPTQAYTHTHARTRTHAHTRAHTYTVHIWPVDWKALAKRFIKRGWVMVVVMARFEAKKHSLTLTGQAVPAGCAACWLFLIVQSMTTGRYALPSTPRL
jgi:hypothetical protein